MNIFSDGLRNLVAGLGFAGVDKRANNEYAFELLSIAQLNAMYRSSWLPRKIVDAPARDMTREWRLWDTGPNELKKIEAEERKFHLKQKVERALRLSRLYGGAAIIIGLETTTPEEPIELDSVSVGDLKYLSVIPRRMLNPREVDYDITSPYFMRPKIYTLNNAENEPLDIHASRLAIFSGNELPEEDGTFGEYWSDSILQTCLDSIASSDATMANVAGLVFESKLDIVKIPNLMANIQDKRWEEKLKSRFSLANLMKSLNGTLVLDGSEEHDTRELRLAGLPDVIDRFFQAVSGAADIPMTRLFGQSPAGLNSTGEGDLANYYDALKGCQTGELGPAMAILDEVLVRSAIGTYDDETEYKWQPLRQMTEKEKAEIAKNYTDSLKTIKDSKILPHEVVARTAVSVLGGGNVLSGIEDAVHQFGEDKAFEEPEPEEPPAIPGQPPQAPGQAPPTKGNPNADV